MAIRAPDGAKKSDDSISGQEKVFGGAWRHFDFTMSDPAVSTSVRTIPVWWNTVKLPAIFKLNKGLFSDPSHNKPFSFKA